MKTISYDELKRRFPGWKIQWRQDTDADGTAIRVYNSPFGVLERIAVIDEKTNRVLFDQYQIEEGPIGSDGKRNPGAVIIPYYSQGSQYFIGLITQPRPVPRDPETYEQGIISLEVPRGFALSSETPDETAIRELGSETGKVVKSLHLLGRVNVNTAFYASWANNYAAEVYRDKLSQFKPDATEKILRSEFYRASEVMDKLRNHEILCGFTKAALMDLFAFRPFKSLVDRGLIKES